MSDGYSLEAREKEISDAFFKFLIAASAFTSSVYYVQFETIFQSALSGSLKDFSSLKQ